ncbi:MAG: type II toxin-antitoxin system VapC family toxin [Myxococcota bacterium]|nr:type II toxin-antitoxin system VapC family toxin [Myxococcota bacterium]
MNLLLDTHVLLWWLGDDPSLSDRAKQAIAKTENSVTVSAVSIWEIAIKRALGKIQIPDEWISVIAEEPFRRLPITWEHAGEVERLPLIHRDPFDRLLIAQSSIEKLTLVTHDKTNQRYAISTLAA